jgi:molybdenum cofactor biosynthesis protein B
MSKQDAGGEDAVAAQHKRDAPPSIRCAVITVSDTRTPATDTGGAEVVRQLESAGHAVVAREIVPDEPTRLQPLLESYRDNPDVDAVLLTGGTGISSRDQTFETVEALLTKVLPGYGELFRMLSYAEIGAAAMLSRTIGGLAGRTVVLTMPGSPAAVTLAMQKVILPELGHLVREARR